MAWLLFGISVGLGLTAVIWAVKLRRKINKLVNKYSAVIDIDAYVSSEEAKLVKRQEDAEIDLDQFRNKTRSEIFNLEKKLNELHELCANAESELNDAEKRLELAREETVLMDYGYYEPNYNFESSGEWERNLSDVNAKIKKMLGNVQKGASVPSEKPSCAGYIIDIVSFNNSAAKGIQMQKASIKLILRAFNGECDAFIAKSNYKNVQLMMKRIEASYEAICKISEKSNLVTINERYKDLKKVELGHVYEYQEWKQREKEEQARIREQIREEERAEKEFEKAKREAEKEAKRNADALEKARSEVDGANEKQKAKLLAQIEELEKRMVEMEEKNRYISQAMLTKTGHVYIISNVGSFGDDMLKIGMTRRLEPMDRVKELGDASVPFPFDVHAMIRTSDAPSLENALHKHFDARRVNLENTRKEFFYVTLEEIQQELDILKDELNIEADIHITMAAEAKQWRMSEAKRKHLERSYEN
ncbi:DUF4041 domain-containing protein [bacterium]|nr:DUF4041 domain-containing protein [bacterium]